MRAACDGIVRWGLAALLLFTPFAFGTVERWSMALMQWAIALLLVVLFLGRLWNPTEETSGTFRTGLEIPFVLVVAFVVFQLVPLPEGLRNALSPGAARFASPPDVRQAIVDLGGHPGPELADFLARVEPSGPRPLSVSPEETRDHLIQLLAYIGLFYLTLLWCDRRERAFWLAGTMTIIGALVATVGLVQSFTWNERVLWFRRAPSNAYPFGPFVNHNHFAAYVEMIIPVAISLGLFLLERQRRGSTDTARPAGLPSGFSTPGREGSWSRASGQAGLALFAASILVVSLFFSLSRGGILSALLSGTILLALFWRRLQSRRTAWALVIGLPAVVVAITVWIGAGIVLDRFQSQPGGASEGSFRYRAVIGSTIVRELPNFLWVGAGLGAFEESFAPYTPPGASARWDKAHNDYLQIAWELGLAGALLVAVTVAIYVWRYAWPAVASFGEPLDLFRTGVAVGLLSIALHSSVDFSLQMGADGALFAVLTGLLVSLTRLTARGKERPEPVPEVAGA